MRRNDSQFKRCPACGETKPLNAFYGNADRPSGCSSYCRGCVARKHRENSETVRANRIKVSFGISLEQYETLLAKQTGVCAICKMPERSKRFKYLAVDHCHVTGRVRGLLCSRCNRALGYFGDDAQRLKSAAVYLENSTPAIPADELDHTLPPPRYYSGAENHKTKLLDTDLAEIGRLASQGWTHRRIASRFGVDHSTVGRFLRGQTRLAS